MMMYIYILNNFNIENNVLLVKDNDIKNFFFLLNK